tara:strand:- start:108 stop:692 length:585 start_codon:yes stop_codon:yes gene_type:complete
MGVLDNTTVTVDAILTKKGRELLAKGQGQFNITKFSLGDDEIDYNLYDVTHPNGSNFYGEAIENMNLLEAIPNQDLALKYPLGDIEASSDGDSTTSNYVLSVNPASLTMKSGQHNIFAAQITGYSGTPNFTFSLSSTEYATLGAPSATAGTVRVTGKPVQTARQVVLTINETNTGKTKTVNITINPSDTTDPPK